MSGMDADLDVFEAALMRLLKDLWHPKSWEAIQRSAKITIDRPGASLLMTLDGASDGGCRLLELAQRMGVEAPSVTRTVQHLEREGLIARTIDPADRRATRVLPTRRGTAAIRAIRRAKRERLGTLLADLSADERKQLARLLLRLVRTPDSPQSNQIK